MRAKTLVFALCWAIFLFGWNISPVGAVELLQPGQPAPRKGILLDVPTSFRVLQVLEDYPELQKENDRLRDVVARQADEITKRAALDEIRRERQELDRERIAFLELQAQKWQQLHEATLALAKQNREAQGTWWDRLKGDVGMLTIGFLGGVGIVAALFF